MNIAICDKNNGEQIKHEILRYMKKQDIESICEIFKTPLDLMVSSKAFDIVILNAEFSEISNTQIGSYLKRFNNEVAIIFIADDYSRLDDAFDVGARRYLVNPIEKTLPLALDCAVEYLKSKTIDCYLENNGTIKRVSKSSIIYLEISGRKTRIVTNNESFLSNIKMQDLQYSLGAERFASPHKSFCVNMEAISEYRRFGGQYYICMTDNKYIPITRTRKPEFEKAYFEFLKNKNLL